MLLFVSKYCIRLVDCLLCYVGIKLFLIFRKYHQNIFHRKYSTPHSIVYVKVNKDVMYAKDFSQIHPPLCYPTTPRPRTLPSVPAQVLFKTIYCTVSCIIIMIILPGFLFQRQVFCKKCQLVIYPSDEFSYLFITQKLCKTRLY